MFGFHGQLLHTTPDHKDLFGRKMIALELDQDPGPQKVSSPYLK